MLHFTKQELAGRRRAACREMARQGLDGLLIFRQKSMYLSFAKSLSDSLRSGEIRQSLHRAKTTSLVGGDRRPQTVGLVQ